MKFAELVLTVCLGAEPGLSNIITEHSQKTGLPETMILAQIHTESRCDANARGIDDDRGLMQIVPKWHRARIERLGTTNLYDPSQNVELGTDIMSSLCKRHGPREALARYNGGDKPTKRSYKYADTVLAKTAEYDSVVDYETCSVNNEKTNTPNPMWSMCGLLPLALLTKRFRK